MADVVILDSSKSDFLVSDKFEDDDEVLAFAEEVFDSRVEAVAVETDSLTDDPSLVLFLGPSASLGPELEAAVHKESDDSEVALLTIEEVDIFEVDSAATLATDKSFLLD